ncbi:secretin N-terminal domain-containing protein [Methylomagnum ishizawai]|uniref:secretin N-terminal domain-containing protein n=1 Tax=Methylomagnum ishizawai TaxID=1760988 RepID=UPI001C337A89|nr:secretin N-terminal domain-containing protein [Methylomagnum ishizawai]BBL76413.1 hypothetical protein MishRS11D_35110 [Methylomagnum ishizawai]
MRRPEPLVCLLLCLAGQPAAWGYGDEVVTTIEVYHRPAEELAELIRPLLGPFETVVPARNQLILKASPERVGEIRSLLDQIDRSPHRLLITVIQGSNLSKDALDTGLGLQGRAGPGGAGIGLGGHSYRLENRDAAGATQQVQTLDGAAASIQAGSQIPVPTQSMYGYGGIDYRPVTTGFSVTPKLMGGQVLIDISPWSDRPSRDQGGVIATQGLHTQVKAALGEWIELGGQTETTTRESHGYTGHTYSTRSQDNRTFLKVEDLDAPSP